MMETIGRVTLDKRNWPGTELYSDGDVEGELLNRLQAGERPAEILAKDDRYAVLYHLSRERENILSWYPLSPQADVLEVGAGCGALTGLLARRCRSVTALDISLTRSRINAYRHQDCENLRILVSNIRDLPDDKRYDVITLIGVFEYGRLFLEGDDPFGDMLRLLASRLKPNGELLIAIENRFGLKYFLGAREEHLWRLYGGLEGYPPEGPRTFSRAELERLLADNGFGARRFYYPNPDYKLPHQIFADGAPEFFRQIGDGYPNYGEYAYRGADEEKVFRALAKEDFLPQMMNSFFVAAGLEQDPALTRQSGEKTSQAVAGRDGIALNGEARAEVCYVKQASLRADRFALQTAIVRAGEGYRVEKTALTAQAGPYLGEIARGAELLRGKMPSVDVVPLSLRDGALCAPFLRGQPLSRILREGSAEEQTALCRRYRQTLEALSVGAVHFAADEGVRAVFGDLPGAELVCLRPAPLDLHFDNLLETDAGWVAIDTEWVFDFPLPLEYILWRAAYLYAEDAGESPEALLAMLGVETGRLPLFEAMERAFREYVYAGDAPFNYNERYRDRAPRLSELLSPWEDSHAAIWAYRQQMGRPHVLPQGSNENAYEYELATLMEEYDALKETHFDLKQIHAALKTHAEALSTRADTLDGTVTDLSRKVQELSEANHAFTAANASLATDCAVIEQRLKVSYADNEAHVRHIAALEDRASALEEQIAAQNARAVALEAELTAMRASTSWRLTGGLRAVQRLLHGAKGR